MIRTLVVDDDFMAASVHRDFAERVPGFQVVGEATTAIEALRLATTLRPDLILLDVYLPDLNGIEVLRRLRMAGHPPADVIAITSAKDVSVLRDAMHLGVVHYIVKPFTFTTLRERLQSYAAVKNRFDDLHHAEQPDIDRLYGLLRTGGQSALPKGISAPTLALVAESLREAGGGVTSAELAARTRISQGIARRYLKFLAASGTVTLTLRYGAAGRPEHIYHWDLTAAPSRD